VYAVAFSPDGQLLASRSMQTDRVPEDGFELRLWDVSTKSVRVAVVLPHRDALGHGLLFNESGQKLLLGVGHAYRVSDLLAWKPADPNEAYLPAEIPNTPDFSDYGTSESTSKSGRATARFDEKANAVELTTPTGTSLLRGFAPDAGYCGYLGFSRDEKTLAIGIVPGPSNPSSWITEWLQKIGVLSKTTPVDTPKFELWDVATRSHQWTLDGHFCGFGRDGKTVLTFFINPEENLIQVWDIPPRRPVGLIVGGSVLAGLLAGLPVLLFSLWRRRLRSIPVTPPIESAA
jgi:hypothetical protein